MARWIDATLTCGAFPMVFGGAMALGVCGIGRGWHPVATAMGLTGAVVIALLILERVHPLHDDWLQSHGDVRTDLIHNLVNLWIPEVYTVLFVGGLSVAAAWLASVLGAPLWPAHWPLAAQLLLALVIGEVGTYWIHRLMHENAFLGRFHATHHSVPRLYWLNAGRFHPLDLFAQQVLALSPLVLLGADTPIIALHTLFTAAHGMFQHCNVKLRIGPFNWVFSMAELHRWHHSPRVDEANRNYGANLILWDIVFQTRFLPRDRQPPKRIGIRDLPNFPRGYWAQLRSPLRWKETEKAARPT